MVKQVTNKLDSFFSKSKVVKYKKGELILRAGEPIFGIYYLKKGFVRQYLISEEGEEVTIHIYRPEAFFPIMLLVTETPNRYYFEATTEVEGFRQSPQKVLEFVKDNPDVLMDLTNRFAQAVIGLSKRIETLTIGSVYAKVLALLFYLAIKFGEEKEGRIIINLPLTHQDISAWTGAKRETVSRQMEKLTAEGIIKVDNHKIVILKRKRLEDALNQYHTTDD
jgi:CRP-like cAMP-binding protein